MAFEIHDVDVIYAEDQEAFRMITIPVLMKAGIVEENVHVAEDGKEAIDHFRQLQAKGSTRPLLMLLDVRMPTMDGHQCASIVKNMVDEKEAMRCPYVVLLTAFLEKRVEEESHNGAVQLSVPKPLDRNQIMHIIAVFTQWWTSRAQDSPSIKAPYNPGEIDIIVAGDEPVCNMALIATLGLVGADDDLVVQADTRDELMDTFRQIQGDQRPVLLFLANASWMGVVRQVVTSSSATSCKPYIVCADVEGEKGQQHFHAVLPASYTQTNLELHLVACHRLWTQQ